MQTQIGLSRLSDLVRLSFLLLSFRRLLLLSSVSASLLYLLRCVHGCGFCGSAAQLVTDDNSICTATKPPLSAFSPRSLQGHHRSLLRGQLLLLCGHGNKYLLWPLASVFGHFEHAGCSGAAPSFLRWDGVHLLEFPMLCTCALHIN